MYGYIICMGICRNIGIYFHDAAQAEFLRDRWILPNRAYNFSGYQFIGFLSTVKKFNHKKNYFPHLQVYVHTVIQNESYPEFFHEFFLGFFLWHFLSKYLYPLLVYYLRLWLFQSCCSWANSKSFKGKMVFIQIDWLFNQ